MKRMGACQTVSWPEGRVCLVSAQGRILAGLPDGEIANAWEQGFPQDNHYWMVMDNSDGTVSFQNNYGARMRYAGCSEFYIEHEG